MQRKSVIIIFIVFQCMIGLGQSNPCNDYKEAIKRGYSFLNANKADDNLEKAQNEFRTAKVLATECGVNDSSAERGVRMIIDEYKKGRERAMRAEKAALRQNKIIAKKSDSLVKMYNQLKTEEQRSDSLEKVVTAVREEKESREDDLRTLKREKENEKRKFKCMLGAKGFDTSEEALQQSRSLKEHSIVFSETPTPKNDSKTYSTNKNTEKKHTLSTAVFFDVKKVTDSLSALPGLQNDRQYDDAVIFMFKRLDDDMQQNVVAKHLLDSSWNELKTLTPDTKQYDLVSATYFGAALYYTWNFVDQVKYDSAKLFLDKAVAFASSIKHPSAPIYSGFAQLYNSYSNYYTKKNMPREAWEAIKTAIDYETQAIRKDVGIIAYQKAIAVYMRNATFIEDSLLSKDDKVAVARMGYIYLFNLNRRYPNYYPILEEYYATSNNFSNRLIDQGYYENAIDTLNDVIALLNRHLIENGGRPEDIFQKRSFLAKACTIYIDSAQDLIMGKKYLTEAFSLISSKKDTTTQADIDQLIGLNGSLINLLKAAKVHDDSINIVPLFSFAIAAFERLAPLSRYNSFSEDIANLITPYTRKLTLDIMMNNRIDAEKGYIALNTEFLPIYLKYRYDFYLGHPLIATYTLYATYLCKNGRLNEAIPILRLASFEGMKESTDSLISIYQSRAYHNSDSLTFYKDRTSYQSFGMKRFTVPTDFDGEKYPFNFYVVDKAKGHPYPGIEDQVKWVQTARKGKVPDDVVSSFDKLQKIAWDNNVSFQNLCVYALGAAKEDESLKKYIPYKERIKQEANTTEKIKLYAELAKMYYQDIYRDTTTQKEVITDAVKIYGEYMEMLEAKDDSDEADKIAKKIVGLLFLKDKRNIDTLLKTKNTVILGMYADLYYAEKDTTNGLMCKVKIYFEKNKKNVDSILQIGNEYILRNCAKFYLAENDTKNGLLCQVKIYFEYNKKDVNNILKIEDTYFLANCARLYLAEKDTLNGNIVQRRLTDLQLETIKAYEANITAYEKRLNTESNRDSLLSIRKKLCQEYSSCCWEYMMQKKFGKLIPYLQRSVELDSANIYSRGNLPHAYLLTGQFEKAKIEYLKLKDKPFGEQGYATFRDAFLADFKEFEKAGIVDENIDKIILLLNKK